MPLVTGAFDEGAPAIGDLPAGLAQAMSTSHEKRLALEEATAAGTDGRCGSSARLLGLLPDSRLHVLAGCGHWTMIERTADFLAVVQPFLGG